MIAALLLLAFACIGAVHTGIWIGKGADRLMGRRRRRQLELALPPARAKLLPRPRWLP